LREQTGVAAENKPSARSAGAQSGFTFRIRNSSRQRALRSFLISSARCALKLPVETPDAAPSVSRLSQQPVVDGPETQNARGFSNHGRILVISEAGQAVNDRSRFYFQVDW
jgi:hypothetical protein